MTMLVALNDWMVNKKLDGKKIQTFFTFFATSSETAWFIAALQHFEVTVTMYE